MSSLEELYAVVAQAQDRKHLAWSAVKAAEEEREAAHEALSLAEDDLYRFIATQVELRRTTRPRV